MDNSARGVWSLNEVGSAITSLSQTVAIRDRVTEEEKEKAKRKRQLAADKKKARALKATPKQQEQLDLLISSEETGPEGEDWKSTLLEVVGLMAPDAFERLSQRLLREAGFTKVEVRGKTGDGGIDGVGVLRVNLASFQVYFQCKKWKGSVGSKEIRDFRGALQG